MFRFSRKMIYAVEAVLYVARHSASAPVQSRSITRCQNIPERYLEQVLQRLVRVGILKGVRGPRGGYQLARPAERITVGEVVGVVRAMEPATNDETDSEGAAPAGDSAVASIFERLDAEVMEHLDRISIAKLAKRDVRAAVAETGVGARALENA